jgi:hypothetical protein
MNEQNKALDKKEAIEKGKDNPKKDELEGNWQYKI